MFLVVDHSTNRTKKIELRFSGEGERDEKYIDLARAKREALVNILNIIYSNKKYDRGMPNGVDNKNGKKKQTNKEQQHFWTFCLPLLSERETS